MSLKNPIAYSEYQKKYRAANRDKLNTYAREYRSRNVEKKRKADREYSRELRKQVLIIYGGKCACCGEKDTMFLTIDHINGGGSKHRKIGGATNISKWLLRNNFPDGFQVLCYNCNCAKGIYGECPHKTKRDSNE
jgi:hypothetical protein